jgi:predicted Fe-Mo cluster-binding NifX family protein
MTDGKLSDHFGHCEQFVVATIVNGKVVNEELLTPPAHEYGAYPKFLIGQALDVVIVGGIGRSAVEIFEKNGVKVISGVMNMNVQSMIADYIKGELISSGSSCNHSHPH